MMPTDVHRTSTTLRPGTGSPPSRRRAGTSLPAYTLIELVVVLSILAVLSTIAAPRLANALAAQRVESAARRVAADLRYAQRQARFTSASRSVTFDVAKDLYDLSKTAGLERAGSPYRVYLSRDPYNASIVSADFGGDAVVIFNGYGIPDTAGTVTIRVGSHQQSVTVDGSTGGIEPVKLLPPQTVP